MGIFWHWNELTPHQVELMLDTLEVGGGNFDDEYAAGELFAEHAAEFWDDLLLRMRRRGRRT